jgi:hypothetical protein
MGEFQIVIFCCDSGFKCKPGLAPAGEALFFASPKKTTEKKGEPNAPPSLRAGSLRCSIRAGSRSNSAIASNNREP